MGPMKWPGTAGLYCKTASFIPQRGPLGPFGVSGDL